MELYDKFLCWAYQKWMEEISASIYEKYAYSAHSEVWRARVSRGESHFNYQVISTQAYTTALCGMPSQFMCKKNYFGFSIMWS